MKGMVLKKESETQKEPLEWGQLTWFANRALGNSDCLTVGECILNPGQSNPLHSHPNCTEVMVLRQGRISHTYPGGDVEMGPGDTMTIPPGTAHQARNLGTADAILAITYSSADRQTKGE